jgi:hypothetical protein
MSPTASTRCIIFHARTQNVFVSAASCSFASGVKSGDYHDLMNGEDFEHWVSTQVFQNLKESSGIVMNNAPHHSVLK